MLCKLDVNLTASTELESALQPIGLQFEVWLQPKRKHKPDFIPTLHSTLRIVVLNLVRLLSQCRGGSLILVGRPDWYRDHLLILQGKITYASVNVVREFLVEQGYVVFRAGTSSASKSFRIPNSVKPTSKFVELAGGVAALVHNLWSDPDAYPIRMKSVPERSKYKPFIPTPATPEVEFMAWKLSGINRSLLSHWPDLAITPEQRELIDAHINAQSNSYKSFDLTKRSLYRVFNNGTLSDGGRFYGGWWQQIPSEFRRFIVIDGKHTVEVDYSAIHPTILYGELGIDMPEDPYLLPIGHRDLVKATFNALINARGPLIKPVDGFSEAKTGMSWPEFRTYVRNSFPMFERYFGTGYGLKLQRLDSDIAEAVMLDFAERGIPILPVHDSFIVHHAQQSLLDASMRKHFEAITGVSVGLKAKAFNEENRLRATEFVEVTKDLSLLLNPQGPLSGSEIRLLQWFSSRGWLRERNT